MEIEYFVLLLASDIHDCNRLVLRVIVASTRFAVITDAVEPVEIVTIISRSIITSYYTTSGEWWGPAEIGRKSEWDGYGSFTHSPGDTGQFPSNNRSGHSDDDDDRGREH